MEYRLQDLAVIASNVNYKPALSVAVAELLRAADFVSYDAKLKEATKLALGYENVEIQEMVDYGQSSYLPGLPLWQPVLMKGVDGQEDMLLESAVIELNRTKNIVSTQIQGRDTSVDEFINNGDWELSISGLLVSKDRSYPIDEVFDFQQFMDRNQPIEVDNQLLTYLGIYEIVVLSQSFPKTPYWNIQTYSFNAKATKPLPLIIEDQPNSNPI